MRFFKIFYGVILFIFMPLMALGQAGEIIETGDNVLDPNQDGFISLSGSGFSGDAYDVDEFELPMFGIPIFGAGEALGDNQNGRTCGITDFALDTAGYALYAYFDPNENLIFRFRLADNSSSVQSYSILIDTDELVGPDDPNSSSDNPGFEIAITLIQKFGVYLYDIDGIASCPTALEEYDDATHQQKATSAQLSCDTQDIYIDFYVPFADLTTYFGITPSSNLRFVGVTNISATCALDGSISDIGGVDDRDYDGCFSCAVLDLSTNQCPTSIDNLCSTCDGFPLGYTATPVINQPLLVGASNIDGTGAPGSDIYIDLFSATGDLIDQDTTQTDADSLWVSNNFNRALEFGDSLVVNAFMPGMCLSGQNEAGLSFAIVDPNLAPVLDGSAQTINYQATAPPVILFEDIEITDDNENLVGARLAITQSFEIGADFLEANPPPGISYSYSPTEGILEFTGLALVNDYQQALRSIGFYNSSITPSLAIRTISLIVNDGNSLSAPFDKNIIIVPLNELPVVTGSADTLFYNEGEGPVNLDNLISLSDADDNEFVTATIKFLEGFDPGEDTLYFAATNEIIANFNDSTLTMIGTTTINNYQNALRSVTYANSSQAPISLIKAVEIIVNDGSDNSIPFNRYIKIMPIIEPPEISLFLGGEVNDTLTYTEGDPARQLIPQLDVQDADDTNLESCTARFITNYQPQEDSLIVDLHNSISSTYNAEAGVLELSGPASLDDYQALLRTLAYINTSDDPSSAQRVVEVFAFDGDSVSNSLFIALNVVPVNDAPVINGNQSAIIYPESSGPVRLDETLNILDPDDLSLTSAKVLISSNFTAFEDQLSFTAVDSIVGSYETNTGELSFLGTASLARYQELLQSVTYENGNAIANRQTRIISFTVNDPELESNPYEIAVQIEEVEDPVIVYQLVTPDGDGLNDYWTIDGILQFPNNDVKLFNRWNNLVYEVNGYNNASISWSGQANSGLTKGELPDGTYFYTVDLNDGTALREGFLILKRK